MSDSRYALLLGFVLFIVARQHVDGSKSDRALGFLLTICALFEFVYALVAA